MATQQSLSQANSDFQRFQKLWDICNLQSWEMRNNEEDWHWTDFHQMKRNVFCARILSSENKP